MLFILRKITSKFDSFTQLIDNYSTRQDRLTISDEKHVIF